MSEFQAAFLRRINIEGLHRQLDRELTGSQRKLVLALLDEAEAQDVTSTPIGPAPMKAVLDGDTVLASTGVILSDWRSGIHTSDEALAALRALYAGRHFGPPPPRLTASEHTRGPG